MTAPTWPLAPVRCAAPEPVALCPSLHRWDMWECAGLWCVYGAGFALLRHLDGRDTTTCAPARGRCGR